MTIWTLRESWEHEGCHNTTLLGIFSSREMAERAMAHVALLLAEGSEPYVTEVPVDHPDITGY